jgi:molybdenum cofactor cytidylyltransferase
MRLTEALRLDRPQVVAFVGGGGKTTAMFQLAAEIAGAGGRVISTTTTRIFAAQTRLAPRHLRLTQSGDLPEEFEAALKQRPHLLLTGPIDSAEGKATGVPPALIDELAQRLPGTYIVIEADGARMRPFKAPGDREPVIPNCAAVVVPVAGADVLGGSLDEAYVHRPEVVARLADCSPGAEVNPAIVAAVVAHPGGGLKGAPRAARVVPLLNKVESPERLAGAREIARWLLRSGRIDSVVLGKVAAPEPVVECWSRTAAVVLAAGGASRMGQPKQLLPWGGSTLVETAVDAAVASQAAEVIVVTGSQGDRVARALAGRPARIVENPDWAEGQSTSVRTGLAALSPGMGAALFLLADQPFVTADLLDALIQRHRETLAPIVAPRAGGRRANPVLFDRAAWPALAAVAGDAGGRGLFEIYAGRVAWVEWSESIMLDVDTPEDYSQALQSSTPR